MKMNSKNKKVAQALLDGRIDIQEIDDRLFAVMLLSMTGGLELNKQKLDEKERLSSYLVSEVFGLMCNSPEVFDYRLHDMNYLVKISKLLEKTFAKKEFYKNMVENKDE